MHFSFTIEVDVDRVEGKFASREDMEAQLIEALEQADPGSLEGENGGQYETSGWEVGPGPEPAKATKK